MEKDIQKTVNQVSILMRSLFENGQYADLEIFVKTLSTICSGFGQALQTLADGGNQADALIQILKAVSDPQSLTPAGPS